MKFTERIEKYLVNNQLNLAIDDFLKLLGDIPPNSNAKTDANELRSQIIVLAGRFNSLNDKTKLGTINPDSATIETTSIINSFVNILNQLPTTYENLNKFIHEKDEETEWQLAQNDNTIKAYQNYFSKFPNGKYVAETQRLILELNDIKRKQEDDIKRVAQEEKQRREQEMQQTSTSINQNNNSQQTETSTTQPKSNKTLVFGIIGVIALIGIILLIVNLASSSNEVTIGKQVWMTENLNVDKFRNGDPIPHAKTDEEWKKAGENNQPAWCYYNNNPDNGDRYGKLYNWHAVNDSRGLAPEGWKIPSDEDWSRLTDFLGGESVAGKKMKSIDFWADFDGESSNNETNESGFSGLPGGFRDYDGSFVNIGYGGDWWSSTEDDAGIAWYRYLYYPWGHVSRTSLNKGRGLSVRCFRD